MFELYHGDSSVCAAKVRLVLAAKGIAFNSHLLDLSKGEQHAPAYLALNPHGVVPTLVHDGAIVLDSTLINEYLDDVAPEPPLRPEAALDRFAMRGWTKRLDDGLHNATSVLSFTTVIRHQRPAPGTPELDAYLANIHAPERRALVREAILEGPGCAAARVALLSWRETLQAMDAALVRSEWLAGDRYSLADAAFTPYLRRLELLQLASMWDQRPHLAAWWDRARAVPPYAGAVEAFLKPAYIETYRRRGTEAAGVFAAALASSD